jgi:hypothetical protein
LCRWFDSALGHQHIQALTSHATVKVFSEIPTKFPRWELDRSPVCLFGAVVNASGDGWILVQISERAVLLLVFGCIERAKIVEGK